MILSVRKTKKLCHYLQVVRVVTGSSCTISKNTTLQWSSPSMTCSSTKCCCLLKKRAKSRRHWQENFDNMLYSQPVLHHWLTELSITDKWTLSTRLSELDAKKKEVGVRGERVPCPVCNNLVYLSNSINLNLYWTLLTTICCLFRLGQYPFSV